MKPLYRTFFTVVLSVVLLFSSIQPTLQPIASASTTPDGAVVRVYFPDKAALDELASTLEIWEVNHDAGYFVTWLSISRMQSLTDQGFTLEIDKAYTEKLTAPRFIPQNQISGIPGYSCYRTVEETQSTLTSLNNTYPDLVMLQDIGDSWDKVTRGGPDGYDLRVIRLTNENLNPDGGKFRFFLIAEAHAREYTTAETATRMTEYLLANYGTDPEITWLLDYGEIHILAMINPDGRKMAEAGDMWRKNTDNDDGCSSDYGVDLNRNLGFKWGGAGTTPCDETYQGPSANSEPENIAFINYIRSIFPDERDENNNNDPAPADYQGLFITLHSYSNLILWPWGFTSADAPNGVALQTLGRKLAYFNHYSPQKSDELYATTGTHDDWAYGMLGVPAFTIEMGNEFFESCSTYENTIWPENRDVLLWAFKTARRPYQTPAGPDIINASVSSTTVMPGTVITLTASANDTRYYDDDGTEPAQAIKAARYSIDNPSWIEGTALFTMSAADGSFNSTIESISAAVETSSLAPGRHTLFIEGQDVGGNWGVPTAVFFNITTPNAGYALLSYEGTSGAGNPGSQSIHTFTLKNGGLVDDTFTLAVSNTPVWATTVNPLSANLAAGESAEITVTVFVPNDVIPGEFDTANITATPTNPLYADTAQAVTVINQVSMLPNIDSIHGNPGETISYTLTITNHANTFKSFDLNLSSNTWQTSVSPNLVGLSAGISKDITVNVTIPENAAEGTSDQAIIRVEMRSDRQHYDTSTLTTSVSSLYDIELSTPSTSQTVLAGQAATYSLTLTNTGNSTDSFDLSANGNTWPNINISPSTVINLSPGASTTVIVTVTTPEDAAGSNDTVTITAQSQTDETNSSSLDLTTTAVDILVGVDLSTLNSVQSVLIGQTATYLLTLTNTGNMTDSFDLTISGNTWADIIITPTEITNLSAGNTATITVTVPVPADAAGISDIVTITAVSQSNNSVESHLDLETTGLAKIKTWNIFLPYMTK